jgi:hypothetical protein
MLESRGTGFGGLLTRWTERLFIYGLGVKGGRDERDKVGVCSHGGGGGESENYLAGL